MARQWLEDQGGQGGGQLADWERQWWQTTQSYVCGQINREDELGVRQAGQPRGLEWGNKASKPLTIKTCGDCGSGRNSQPHKRVHWRNSQGPRMHTKPPPLESAPEGPNLLVGSRGSDSKPAKS